MPFGISKKDKESKDESSARSALFGIRSKKDKAPAQSSNPYAVQAGTPDPYASTKPVERKYSPPQSSHLSQPPAYDGRSPSPLRNDKSPVPPGGYGGGGARFGGQGNYGQQGGYGSTPYGNEQQQAARPGGYGGLGRTTSNETMGTDAGRAALFGDAPQRQMQQPPSAPQDNAYAGGSSGYNASSGYGNPTRDALFGDAAQRQQGGGYAGSSSELYGADGNRNLTAEEQEEEDVQAAKSEIKFIKQQDVASTRNALRIAQQSEATARETLARLGAQGDRIHNTERNLDMASNQNRLAEEKARELKTLNRSMFAVHVANPFTAKKREEAAVAIALDKHQAERKQADDTRANAYSTTARHAAQGRELKGGARHTTDKASLAQRAKYQFEADSEDDEMENEIDGNLEAIHKGARSLNLLGQAMGQELDEQNKHIGRINDKTDVVDDQIAMNRARLGRIR